ncbi:hypothetical protein ACLKOZ_18320 [Arthrobacter sp. R4]|uniref:hypothetical protein n=1 Tax=Arthrobacter sp. R4 TaxID=644417 RepID=UPI003EDA5D57
MGLVRTAKVTGLVAAGVILGLATVGGSYALWNKLVPAGAGTVRSADFLVTLTGSNSSGTHDMVLADGTPATIALTSSAAPLGQLFPGVPVYAGVSVGNATAAGSAFTVLATLPDPAIITDAGPGTGISGYLSVQAATATDLAQCASVPSGDYQGGFPGVQIPKGTSAVICFRIQLAPQAPSTLQGQSASVSVPLFVEQIL